jgi:coenzyme F420 hydrogenase subunit beta
MCIGTCPPLSLNLGDLAEKLFGNSPKDSDIGHQIDLSQGFSSDDKARHEGSSGGVGTILISHLLKSGAIDAALLVKSNPDNPIRPIPFLAYSSSEVFEAKGSKYYPVPLNTKIREILEKKIKVAVVGLPCHLHGLRLASSVNSDLNELIVAYIGLFCGKTPSANATNCLCRVLGHDPEHVLNIAYRGQGWPGVVRIASDSGASKIEFRTCWKYFLGSNYFTQKHCLMCEDFFAELSDISLGDAWLDSIGNDTIGRSLIITRTCKGQDIIDKMSRKKLLRLWPVSASEVKNAFVSNIIQKKKLSKTNQFNNAKNDKKLTKFQDSGCAYDKIYLAFQDLQRWIGENRFLLQILIKYPPTFLMKCMLFVQNLLWFLVVRQPDHKDFFKWTIKKCRKS